MRRWVALPHLFLRNEAGGAIVLGMFALVLTALFVGFAIDASNLYRQQSILQHAADTAAHAGVVVLAKGGTAEDAEAAAAEMLEANLPAARFGRVVADPVTDIRALAFDSASRKLVLPDPETPANAVLVRLQRSTAVGNPVPTYVLRLFSRTDWTTGATGVSALVTTRYCPNSSGFFARDVIELANGVRLGDGFCLHSQNKLVLPRSLSDRGGLRASVPALENCNGPCDEVGAIAMNLMMPNAADHVLRLAEGFARSGFDLPEKKIFFTTRDIAADFEPLKEVGIDTESLLLGSVVQLSPFAFSALREVPAGLVYLVTCDRPAAKITPNSIDWIDLGRWPDTPPVRDIALVTNCPLTLGAFARIEGSLVIALHDDRAVIEVAPGARMGDVRGKCVSGNRSQLMTIGDLVLPSDLAGSGLGVVAGGNVTLVLNDDDVKIVPPNGFAVHAGAHLSVKGEQSFETCPDEVSDPLLPRLQVITQTMPPLEGWVTPLIVKSPDLQLPGTAVERLQMTGSRTGS